jgi:plastocyanin
MNRIVTLLLVGSSLLLAGALSACGGSDGSSESAASAPATAGAAARTPVRTATPTATDWPDGKTTTRKSKDAETKQSSSSSSGGGAAKAVAIKGFAFGPSNLTVKVGQKITWTNDDDAPHTVTGGELASGTLAKGASFSFTADKAGTIAYICSIHPTMKGTITVQ